MGLLIRLLWGGLSLMIRWGLGRVLVCNEGVLKKGEVCYCWVVRVLLWVAEGEDQYFGAVRLRHSEESQAGQGVGAWHLATTTWSIVPRQMAPFVWRLSTRYRARGDRWRLLCF